MKMMTKKTISLLLVGCLLALKQVLAFCGFYVAKAGADLYNDKSQVILVRDGNRTIITMSNDFKGDVKDFAMVVPVPVVLQKEDIKVVERLVFDKLDAYSAPRLVEYHDYNPCNPPIEYDLNVKATVSKRKNESLNEDKTEQEQQKVHIEAQYTVGEYDIIILSATESGALKTWLTTNGYKIPEQAEEVLDPYIKSNLKFFVVKVNLDNQKSSGYNYLRPIQIKFNSPRFMLPIRLGMANASGAQDLIVYSFTRKGRIEAANYRTVKVPTDRNIPEYVQARFNKFYSDMFDKAYKAENRNAVFLEYAWNVSPYNYVKCDPCVSTPPDYTDFTSAGVDWMRGGTGYNGNETVFFTRLHVRYTRDMFPQDLMFMETPNQENFQGRYIITHPAKGTFECEEGQKYLSELGYRRQRENAELAALTGWDMKNFEYYPKEYNDLLKEGEKEKKNDFSPVGYSDNNGGNGNNNWRWMFYLSLSALIALSIYQFTQIRIKRNV